MDLAELVSECRHIDRDMANFQGGMSRVTDVDMQRRLAAAYLSMQSFAGQCQAVNGNLTKIRHTLLEIARKGQIAGAAAQLYLERIRDKDIISSVVSDAHRGDLNSLVILAYTKADAVGIHTTQQNYLRLALVEAATDARTSHIAKSHLELAERIYTAANLPSGSKLASFELDKTSISRLPVQQTDDAKAEAKRIVEKILERNQGPN